jgi:hypothetical protein
MDFRDSRKANYHILENGKSAKKRPKKPEQAAHDYPYPCHQAADSKKNNHRYGKHRRA